MRDGIVDTGFEQVKQTRRMDALGTLSFNAAFRLQELEDITSPGTSRLLHDILSDHPDMEVRPEQAECLDVLAQARADGEKRALVHMATGLGKTTVAAADAKRFIKENPGARVLFLCHQNRILDQARERFASIIGPVYTYGTFTGEEQEFENVDCWFASLQMMRVWYPAMKADEFDYIAVDESHHAKADTYEPILRHFKPKFLLGITGTPDRHDLKDIREIFGTEKYSKPLAEAIAEGLLSEVDYSIILDDIERERLLRDVGGNKHNIRQLNRTIFVPLRDREIVRVCIEKATEFDVPPRRLVFCASIEQAEEYAQYFDDSAPIHTKLSKWEIKQSLDRFRSGELQTLLTVDMFNEGIDVPEVNQLVFLRLTQSKNIFLQQLGRGLRKFPGKEKVQALDFVANGDRLAIINEFWQEVRASVASETDARLIKRIEIPHVRFSETTLDILDVLDDIESSTSYYRNWSADDSKFFYTALSNELGRPAGIADIIEKRSSGEAPPYKIVIRDYDMSLRKLREACGYADNAPEGWYSINSAADELGVTNYTIARYVKSLEWELPVYRFGPIRTGAISPAQFEELKQLPAVLVEPAPETVTSLYNATRILRTGEAILRYATASLNIELQVFRFGPRAAYGFTQDQLARVQEHPLIKVPYIEKGWHTLKSGAKALGIDYYKLKQLIKEEGIELDERKTKGGQIVGALNPEQLDLVRQNPKLQVKNAPDEVFSIPRAAELIGVSSLTFSNLAKGLGIVLKDYKFRSRHSPGVALIEIEKINDFYINKLELLPPGYLPLNEAAVKLNMYRQALDNLMKDLEMEPTIYRNKNRATRSLSPEQFKLLKIHPRVKELVTKRKGAPPKKSRR
ncbi:DEAD/DEAH box helicase [Candidatus Saccharibacteria bacterium]|nr:DEAD/DEAH box helicase [Candidatus Saccharibacteria bacterium]